MREQQGLTTHKIANFRATYTQKNILNLDMNNTNKNPSLLWGIAGPPDMTTYLYYSTKCYVEGITLMGSLLPATFKFLLFEINEKGNKY